MKKNDSKHEALRALKGWLESVSHAQLAPVEEGTPSPAAERIHGIVQTLRQGIEQGRLFLTNSDEGVRSPIGPMMILLDADGALIAGVAGPAQRTPRSELPASLRHRFTWP